MPLSFSGLSFIAPAGMWALLVLAIPVLIHLFNRSRGRLVRIGHIDLIRKARKLRVTEIKLAQWLLLILRLGIFTLAALILAGLAQPGLKRTDKASIYVTPAWVSTATQTDLDSLLASKDPANRIILLRNDFATLTPQLVTDIRQAPLDSSLISNIWPLLAERLSVEQHSGVVDVYATDYVNQYGHNRVALPREVNWNIAHPDASPPFSALPLRVTVAYDSENLTNANYYKAALSSIKTHRLAALNWQLVQLGDITSAQLQADRLIILSDGGLTDEQLAIIDASTTQLLDVPGNPTQADFPQRLLQQLLTTEQRTATYANGRVSAQSLYLEQTPLAAAIPQPRRNIQSLLALLLALLWVAERWLSERRPDERP